MGGLSAIQVEGLSFEYDGHRVLQGLVLDLPQECFTVLLGRNGSGKSTLLKILAGQLDYRQGSVAILGQELRALPLHQRARLVGYLPQHHRPVFPFSVLDVVLTGRASHVRLLPSRADEGKAVRALERVGILHLQHRPFTELSGGEQQLVRIARLLAQESQLLLLDEPASHLDFVNQARLLALVRELVAEGLSALAVLHDPNNAFLYGDHFVLLQDGHIAPLEPGQQPWDQEVMEQLYATPVQTLPFAGRALVVPQLHVPIHRAPPDLRP